MVDKFAERMKDQAEAVKNFDPAYWGIWSRYVPVTLSHSFSNNKTHEWVEWASPKETTRDYFFRDLLASGKVVPESIAVWVEANLPPLTIMKMLNVMKAKRDAEQARMDRVAKVAVDFETVWKRDPFDLEIKDPVMVVLDETSAIKKKTVQEKTVQKMLDFGRLYGMSDKKLGDVAAGCRYPALFDFQAIERNLANKRETVISKSTWTTADGRVIPIPELEDGHLVNILNFLHRRGKMNNDVLEEAHKRGIQWMHLTVGQPGDFLIDGKEVTVKNSIIRLNPGANVKGGKALAKRIALARRNTRKAG